MKFIAKKLSDGDNKRKVSLYCRVLQVSRQAIYDYRKRRDRPWKYEALAREMRVILEEDKENDTYGRKRMYEALKLRNPEDVDGSIHIPSERTVYRVMKELGICHRPRRKQNGITKADRAARKSENLLRRNFRTDMPCKKCVTDITEIPAKDGKLYVSAIFDCFNGEVLGLCMRDNMKANLCVQTVENACRAYPALRGAILHSDRGSQYTSEIYRKTLARYGILQSMNSDGGRCHDNARCESMWGRMKEELLYGRYDTKRINMEDIKVLIWRYFMSYWKNRRICSFNDGLPPKLKKQRYYENLRRTA